ncbi:MAG: polyprenyl synthetase family protein [Ktedonobacterales bacterium]
MSDTSAGSVSQRVDPEVVLVRYRPLLAEGMREALEYALAGRKVAPPVAALLNEFGGQIEYHLGWRNPDLSPAQSHPGKLLRPTLVLLACELAAGRRGAAASARDDLVRRVVPAAACVELVHNFSLIHDDIEDGDEERRHRPTLWKLWGIPQAINTGDGLFSLARQGLWRLVDSGIAPLVVVRLAALLDRTCLELCEGQFLDMRYEGRRDITVEMYLEMIGRKTAALMACSTEMGAHLGAPDDVPLAGNLARFGRALGLAFQLRDDLLGIWATKELGKSYAGDLRRKKMTLPVIHAFETASGPDRATLDAIYLENGPASEEQMAAALTVLERTSARARVASALAEQGALARAALDEAAGDLPEARQAHELLAALLDFVVTAAD